jgi:hypothetical protein
MKKIVRLTESDLARIVRRVINEEMECDAYCVWKKLRNHYEPKGFKYSTDPDGNEMLTKGKDPNASYVQFYHFDTKNSSDLRGVFRYGKPGVNGKVSGDHRVVDKVYSTITSKI